MKKKILAVFILSVIFIMMGCGKTTENDYAESEIAVSQKEMPETEMPETESIAETEISETVMPIPETPETETSETEPSEPAEIVQPTISTIDFASLDTSFFVESAEAETPIALSLVSEQGNSVSEVHNWFSENELFLPMLGQTWAQYIPLNENMPTTNPAVALEHNVFYDDNYIYEWIQNSLDIYDRNTARLLHYVSYQTDRWYLMGNCAYLRDGILYIGHIFNGYAYPGTCYLLAYDIENETVLWRSEDQTYNTMNFIVKGDVIICGYGFTNEEDFLYQIDMNTGKVIAETELKKMPDLLVEKDGQLYVHTYSYDYVFDMDGGRK